jgi:hypothetical protein
LDLNLLGVGGAKAEGDAQVIMDPWVLSARDV